MIFTSSYRTFDLGWGKTCAIAHFLHWNKFYHLSYFPTNFRPFWVIHGLSMKFPPQEFRKKDWGKMFWPYRDSTMKFSEGFQCLKLQKHQFLSVMLQKIFQPKCPCQKGNDKFLSRNLHQTFDLTSKMDSTQNFRGGHLLGVSVWGGHLAPLTRDRSINFRAIGSQIAPRQRTTS